jgi:hypothetical protein
MQCESSLFKRSVRLLFGVILWWHYGVPASSVAQSLPDDVASEFAEKIVPFLRSQCESCHSGAEPEARFSVTEYYDLDRVEELLNQWQFLVTRVTIGDMPPADQGDRPSVVEIEHLNAWTENFRKDLAKKRQGDPGCVAMRRLNHAEYNNVIHDLTGQDIQPTISFPIDSTNEAGFDNSSESLTTTPALVTKYLDAARFVAEHLLLVPEGIRFAPFPVVTETDRDRYCVQRIVDFYRRQPTDIYSYLLGCWELAKFGGPLEDVASNRGISLKYLTTIHAIVNDEAPSFGPIAEIVDRWNSTVIICEFPAEAEVACRALEKFIVDYRAKLSPEVPSLQRTSGLNEGSQTLILWRNREMASLRQSCRTDIFDQEDLDSALLERDRSQLASHRDSIIASYSRFCEVFPDAFMITERGRHYSILKRLEGKGRLLSAGFHSMTGYFRDDEPLCRLILDDQGQQELDALWRELEIISHTPMRQYAGFIWFERAEASFINEPQFHFIRAEDREAYSQEMIQRMKDLFIEKIKRGDPSPQLLEAVEQYFVDINRQIRSVETELLANEQHQVDALIEWASKAFRRSLEPAEEKSLRQFYDHSRQMPSADHRSAIEDTLVAILMSPHFLFRWDLKTQEPQERGLSDLELASRLSFFLWGSGPDEALMQAVRGQYLGQPEQLKAQVNRMLDDPRSQRMIRDFLGNWLDFRRFESHGGVDREQFPAFNDELRNSMAKEPIQFFWDLLNSDGRLEELIDSGHVVVDQILAEYYGMNGRSSQRDHAGTITNALDGWERHDGARQAGRGGLLSMGVFLTQNSPGLRTSPVKRGYWVVRKLLGEKIPPPPPNVPELPDSERETGESTLRELLARHREHASCAACHNRFDSVGLLLEEFDPVGRPRTVDMAGRPIASAAALPEGVEYQGLEGLKEYLMAFRMEELKKNFCENLVAYALGRTLIVSDDLLVDEMMQRLSSNGNRLRSAFEMVVESPQFLNKRGVQIREPAMVNVLSN